MELNYLVDNNFIAFLAAGKALPFLIPGIDTRIDKLSHEQEILMRVSAQIITDAVYVAEGYGNDPEKEESRMILLLTATGDGFVCARVAAEDSSDTQQTVQNIIHRTMAGNLSGSVLLTEGFSELIYHFVQSGTIDLGIDKRSGDRAIVSSLPDQSITVVPNDLRQEYSTSRVQCTSSVSISSNIFDKIPEITRRRRHMTMMNDGILRDDGEYGEAGAAAFYRIGQLSDLYKVLPVLAAGSEVVIHDNQYYLKVAGCRVSCLDDFFVRVPAIREYRVVIKDTAVLIDHQCQHERSSRTAQA